MTTAILTVSALNRQARQLLEQSFPLFWVSGEISNLTRASSGHAYFSLKDAEAQVRCVMFRSRAERVPWKLENGQQVEVQALVTLYEARGDFQLNVEGLRRAGIGRLYEQFIQLREKLARSGLFDTERKRAIPRFPRRVGIITSPQAAALRDVMVAFARRAPHVELVIYPTRVQGAEAPAELIAALTSAASHGTCDLLLIVRGGGSLEDLWAFNDEALAQAIAVSPTPTISGIGHETDTTIADYVADQRAATPTAAAELASAGWFETAATLTEQADALRRALQRGIEERMQALDRLALRLIHPAQRLASGRQHLELLNRRLHQAITHQTLRQHNRLAHCSGALAGLSPTATLERGYSITRDPQGHIVRDASHLSPGAAVNLHFARGTARATVEAVQPAATL